MAPFARLLVPLEVVCPHRWHVTVVARALEEPAPRLVQLLWSTKRQVTHDVIIVRFETPLGGVVSSEPGLLTRLLKIEGDAELTIGTSAERAGLLLVCVPALVVLRVVPEGLVSLAEQTVVEFLLTHRRTLRSDHCHSNF